MVTFFSIVVIAAGASGIALLVAPGSTHRYFSWTLNPPAAAALIGGFYLASAVVFAWGLTRPWRQARALLVGVLGLAVPTLVLSIVHDEVFDFGRWQALAWMALFITAPFSATLLLVAGPKPVGKSPNVPIWCRYLLAGLTIALAVLAVVIWLDGTRRDLGTASPVDLIRLTGTYLGAWCSFFALLCGFAAVTGGWDESGVALVTVAAASAGTALAFLRSIGDIRHAAIALAVSVGLAVLALAAYNASRPASDRRAAAG